LDTGYGGFLKNQIISSGQNIYIANTKEGYDIFGGSPSSGVADYLELEDDSFLFQENGFKLVLEQENDTSASDFKRHKRQ
jgi:hypothetical protein